MEARKGVRDLLHGATAGRRTEISNADLYASTASLYIDFGDDVESPEYITPCDPRKTSISLEKSRELGRGEFGIVFQGVCTSIVLYVM